MASSQNLGELKENLKKEGKLWITRLKYLCSLSLIIGIGSLLSGSIILGKGIGMILKETDYVKAGSTIGLGVGLILTSLILIRISKTTYLQIIKCRNSIEERVELDIKLEENRSKKKGMLNLWSQNFHSGNYNEHFCKLLKELIN